MVHSSAIHALLTLVGNISMVGAGGGGGFWGWGEQWMVHIFTVEPSMLFSHLLGDRSRGGGAQGAQGQDVGSGAGGGGAGRQCMVHSSAIHALSASEGGRIQGRGGGRGQGQFVVLGAGDVAL